MFKNKKVIFTDSFLLYLVEENLPDFDIYNYETESMNSNGKSISEMYVLSL